jgi:hypothetical protein
MRDFWLFNCISAWSTSRVALAETPALAPPGIPCICIWKESSFSGTLFGATYSMWSWLNRIPHLKSALSSAFSVFLFTPLLFRDVRLEIATSPRDRGSSRA